MYIFATLPKLLIVLLLRELSRTIFIHMYRCHLLVLSVKQNHGHVLFRIDGRVRPPPEIVSTDSHGYDDSIT